MLFLNQFSHKKGHFPVVYSENLYQGRHAGDLFCNAREIKEKMRFLKEIKRQILWILHCILMLYHWPTDNLIVSNATRDISYMTTKLYTTAIDSFKIVVNN